METYQIKMDEMAQKQLKKRAKQYEMNIGDFVEQLLSSFELKLSVILDILELEESEFIDIESLISMSLVAFTNKGDYSKERVMICQKIKKS